LKLSAKATTLRIMSDNNYKTRQTLLEKIKDKHDDAAWEDFVFYYRKFITILCRKMNVTHHDSEEIVQKVLLKSWKALPEFEYDEKKKFRGWLCTVTKNTVNEFFRYVGRQNNKIENASKENIINPLHDKSLPEIDVIAEAEWNTYIANMALLNIKDTFNEKMIKIFLELSEGATPSEVSEKMGIPKSTIAVYKQRVKEKLQDEIRRLNYEIG
jgi:RNA polymerase sigma factor (sigma-70 family)